MRTGDMGKWVVRLAITLIGSIPIIGPMWVFGLGVKRGMIVALMLEHNFEERMASEVVENVWPIVSDQL